MPEGLNLGGERSMGATPAASQAEPLVPSARLYIDCEFDGHGGPLLSIAMVDEVGCSIHVQTDQYPTDPWVQQNVMPIMDAHDAATEATDVPLDNVGFVLRNWLGGGDQELTVVADSPVDIGRFCEAISTARGGGWQSTGYAKLTFEVHNVDCYPTDLEGAVQHNAWWDAMALRHKLASAMSTGTAKTPQAVEGQSPASAVANGETPKDPQEPHQ